MSTKMKFPVRYTDGNGEHVANVSDLCVFGRDYGSDLISVVIPEGVMEIDAAAFSGCHRLESVSLPSTLESLGDACFADCGCLKLIEIPDGVHEIPYRAFQGCGSLESVRLPDNLSSIGECAFERCENLKSVNMPGSVGFVGTAAFRFTGSLDAGSVRPNPDCTVAAGAFDFTSGKSRDMIVEYGDGKTGIIDVGILSSSSHRRYDDLEGVVRVGLPEGMTYLGSCSFRDNDTLRELDLPASMERIGIDAAVSCKNLSKVNFASGQLIEVPLGADARLSEYYDDTDYHYMTLQGEHDVGFTGSAFAGCPVDRSMKLAYAGNLMRQDDDVLRIVADRIAMSGALDLEPGSKDDFIAADPDKYGSFKLKYFRDSVRTFDDSRRFDHLVDLMSDHEYFPADQADAARMRVALALSGAGSMTEHSRDIATAYIRKGSVMQNAKDRTAIPSPSDWRADMTRRLKFGEQFIGGTARIEQSVSIGQMCSKVSPFAGALYDEATRYSRNRDSETPMRILRDEIMAAMPEAGNKPVVAFRVDSDDKRRKSAACPFYTIEAAEMYIRECVSSDTGRGRDNLIIEGPDRDAVKRLAQVYDERIHTDVVQRPFSPGDDGWDRKPMSPLDYANYELYDSWLDRLSDETKAALKKERECQRRADGHKPSAVATVSFRMCDDKFSDPMPLYTKEGLLAYVSASVSPSVSDAGVSVRLADRSDRDLAYDVYAAVKEAQGVTPKGKVEYLARYDAAMARHSAAAERQSGTARTSGQGLNRRLPDAPRQAGGQVADKSFDG